MFNFSLSPFPYKAVACLVAVLTALGFAAPSVSAQTPELHISAGPRGGFPAPQEGGTAQYTISSDVMVSSDLPVNLTCTENFGGVGDTAVTANRGCSATILQNTDSVTLTIQLRDDDVFHGNNRMFIRINEPGDGSYTLGGGTDRWFNGNIPDNEMGVSIIGGAHTFLVEGEGAKALFDITVTPAGSQDLTVKLASCGGFGGYAVRRVDNGGDLACNADVVIPAGESRVTLTYRADENSSFSFNGGEVVFSLASDPAYGVDAGNNSVTAKIFDKWSSPPVRLDITYRRPLPDPNDPNRIISTNARHIPPGAKSLAVYRVRNIGTEPIATVWIHHNVGNGNYPNPVLTLAHSEPQIPPTSDGHTVVERRRGEGFCGRITGDEDAPISDVFVHESQNVTIARNQGLGNQGVLWVKLDVDPPLPPNNHCRINVDITPPAGTPPDTYYGSATVHFPGAVPVTGFTNVTVLGDVSASGGQTDSPVIRLFDSEVVEGNSGERTMVFNAAVFDENGDAAVSSRDVAFCVELNPSTTANLADFTPVRRPGCVGGYRVVAGVHRHRILFGETRVQGDIENEPNETIVYDIGVRDSGAAVFEGGGTTATVTGTIIDDDLPTFSITGPADPVLEGSGSVVLTVTLSETLSVPVTVDYATADGTATAGEDYTAAMGTLNFPANGATEQTITVLISDDDAMADGERTFTVNLSAPNPTDATALSHSASSAEVRITDETPMLVVDSPSAREGSFLVFTVRLVNSKGEPLPNGISDITVSYETTTGGSAEAQDFTAVSSTTLTIPAGATSATFTVETIADADEEREMVQVRFSNLVGGAAFAEGASTLTVTGAITEAPEFSITGGAVDEDDGSATLTISLSEKAAATVTFATSDGTATEGEDYTARNGTLNFTAGGGLTREITVPVLADDVFEGDQTFTVTLSNPDGDDAILSDTPYAVVTITDGDSEPVIAVAETSAREGNPLVFTARLVNSDGETVRRESGDVTVSYMTVPTLTVNSETPAEEEDFEDISAGRTLTISEGEAMATFTVETVADDDSEDETVTVELSGIMPTSTMFANGETTLTVTGEIVEVSVVEEANKAVLPQVAVATAMQITGAVSGRIDTVFNRTAENDFSVRGKNWKQFLASEAEKARGNERAELPDLDLNLSDFAFSIASNGDEWGDGDYGSSGGVMDNIGIWGRGYYAGVDVKEAGDASNVDFDGSIVGGVIGADVLLNDKVVTGLGVNFSKSGVDFTVGDDTGTHDTTVWSFHPYFGLKAGPGVTFYATMGYGIGSLEAMETGGGTPRENDVSLLTGGAGGKGTVYDTKAGAWDLKVNVVGDFVYAQLSEDGGIDGSGGIFRGGFEIAGDSGGGAGASLELAYRADFGDTVGGSGLEVGGGLRFGSPSSGISVNLDGRILAYHSEELSEYGFSGDVSWSRGKTGPYAKFSPTWGAVNDRRDDLWENGANGWSEADSSGRRYNFEAGYGVGLPEEAGIMKLFARSEMEDGETVFRSGGVDVEVGSGLTAGYETVDRSGATVEHRGYLRFGGAF